MNYEELNGLTAELNISKDQILREEAEMMFLNELADNKLGTQVVFYGGTALRLAYSSPRFSEDIDLITIKPVEFKNFKSFINQVVKNNSNWKVKDIKNKRKTMFALLLIKDEKLKHAFSLKIEIHKPAKRIKLITNLSLIKSQVSILEPLLLVPTLAELKRLKEEAIMDRQKARDIFDLWYISQALKINFELPGEVPAYSERKFKNELQVFLPKKFYPIIFQLYDKINRQNK